eukprot:516335_1
MSTKKYTNPVANQVFELKEKYGQLEYSKIGQYLDFDEDYYIDLDTAFNAAKIEKYNLQQETDLKIYDQAPDCLISGPINTETMDVVNKKVSLSTIINSTNKRFLVLNFGSYT